MAKTQYWQFQNANSKKKSVDINIFGEIGQGGWFSDATSASSFDKELKKHGDLDVINLYINSPGGSVFEAAAIYNTLKMHKAKVNAYVMGLAASAASYIIMAADTIVVPVNSMIMIHSPLIQRAGGNAKEFRKLANTLDSIEESLIAAYKEKTKLSEEKIKEMLDEETWLTATEALDLGFADQVDREFAVAASIDDKFLNVNGQRFDLSAYKNIPTDKIENKEINTVMANQNPIMGAINYFKSLLTKEQREEIAQALKSDEIENEDGTEVINSTDNEQIEQSGDTDATSEDTSITSEVSAEDAGTGEEAAEEAAEETVELTEEETEITEEVIEEDAVETEEATETEDAKKDDMKKKKKECMNESEVTEEVSEEEIVEDTNVIDVQDSTSKDAVLALQEQINALNAQVAALNKEKAEAKAEIEFKNYKENLGNKFSGLVGTEEEIINHLYTIHKSELSQETKNFLFTNLENKSEVLASITDETGTSAVENNTAKSEFETKAIELANKKGISVDKAKTQIIERDPQLYERLRAEEA